MIGHNAEIQDWSKIEVNWQIATLNYGFPLILSKDQVDAIIKFKMNLQTLWDDYAVEISNSAGTIIVKVRDILLLWMK